MRIDHKVLNKGILVLLLATTLLLQLPTGTDAVTIEPFFKDYLLEKGDSVDDSFTINNTSEDQTTFKIYVDGYNAENEEFIKPEETKIFVTPQIETITLEPQQSQKVPFRVNIPGSAEPASYFNIIVLEEVPPGGENDENVNLKMGFGMIAAMHVVPENSTVSNIFKSSTQTILDLIDKGIPYLTPTKLKYTFENPTGFVFEPIGEIRIYDIQSDKLIEEIKINPDEVKTYGPGSYEMEFERDLWNYNNLTHGFRVVSRTYNNLDEGYIESVLEIGGFSPVVFMAAGLALLVVVYLVLRLVMKVVGGDRKKGKDKNKSEGKKTATKAGKKEGITKN